MERLGDLLLDRTVACGLGNVYRSELPFLERLAPGTRPCALHDARLAALYERARALLLASLGDGARPVYGCRRCQTDPVRRG